MTQKKQSGGDAKAPQKLATRLNHIGRTPSENFGFVNPPVYRGSTILYPTVAALKGKAQRYTYGRRGTPTLEALENAITELESGAHTVLTSSGLSACAVALLSVAKSGGHILVTDSVYQPVRKICNRLLSGLGVETTFYDPAIGSGIADLIRPETHLVYTESPGSQTFEIQDLRAIAEAAHARDIPVVADNTWGTPLYYNPLVLGADFVIHAGTKYLGGHADVNLGSVTTTERYAAQLRETHGDMGQCAAPEDANLSLRGLRTLSIRLEHHQRAGLDMANWLSGRDEVARVLHPGLENDPGHALWKRDFKGASGLFAVVLHETSLDKVAAMLDGLELYGMGASWGGYESLALPFNPTSYRTAVPWTEKGQCIRFFIGLEDLDDLKADLDAGFARMKAA